MVNLRFKKNDIPPHSDDRHTEEEISKDETLDNSFAEDELSRKRRMLLTGITSGVAVAGASAGALLFFGPFSNSTKQEEPTQQIAQQAGTQSNETKQVIPVDPLPEKDPTSVKKAIAPSTPIVSAQPSEPTGNTEKKVPMILPEKEQVAVAQEIPFSNNKKDDKVTEPKKPAAQNLAIPPAPVIAAAKQKIPEEETTSDESKDAVYNYDIQDGGPVITLGQFSEKKKIIVSRDPEFKKIYLNGKADAYGKYRISIPPPGEIYWKEDGKTTSHKINIIPPQHSGLYADIPEKLKYGQKITWSVSGKVSFYRIEVATDSEFLNRVKVFSTQKSNFPVENIGQGKWFIKISALNLQRGTWDYLRPISLIIEEGPLAKVTNEPENKKQETSEIEKSVEPVAPVEATVPAESSIENNSAGNPP